MIFAAELMRVPVFLFIALVFYFPARISQSYFRYEELYVGAWGYFFIFMGLSFGVGFPGLLFDGYHRGWVFMPGSAGAAFLLPILEFGGSFRFSFWKIDWYPFRHFTVLGLNIFCWLAGALGMLTGAVREWSEYEALQGLYNEKVYLEKRRKSSSEILAKENVLPVYEIQDDFLLIAFSKRVARWQYKVDGILSGGPTGIQVLVGVFLWALFSFGIYKLLMATGGIFLSKAGILRFFSFFVGVVVFFAGLYLRVAENLSFINKRNAEENERRRELLRAERQVKNDERRAREQAQEAKEHALKAKEEAEKRAVIQAQIDEQLRKKYLATEPLKPSKEKSKKPGFWDDDKGDF